MSVNTEPVDPDNVLWYWFDEVHRSSKKATQRNNYDHIRRFERFLAVEGGYDYEGSWTDIDPDEVPSGDMLRPRNVDDEIVYRFFHSYLSEEYGGGTQQQTASNLSSAYDWCVENTEPVDADPIGYVQEHHPDLLDDSSNGRDPYIIDIEEARRVVNGWDDPRYLAINLLLAKSLRRVGGVVNLDVRDINIDHPACDWTVHNEIRRWPDHIVFSQDRRESDAGRKTGSKTETTRITPIDGELKDALLMYLEVRRGPLNPDEPFFRSVNSDRIAASSIRSKFKDMAKEMGYWYGPNDDDNVNPHYWRHWSTTKFEDRLGEDNSIVTYFRGDKGEKTKGRYNHWTEEKERLYREHVPKFFTGEVRGET